MRWRPKRLKTYHEFQSPIIFSTNPRNNHDKQIPVQHLNLPVRKIGFFFNAPMLFLCMMKKTIKIGIGLLIIGIIAGALGYVFIYNKPHRDFEKARPDFTLAACELFDSYISGRESAEAHFNGKVILLEGPVQKIEQADSMVIAVFVFQEGIFGDEGIRCTMLPKYNQGLMKVKPETYVKIKGYCTGYNDTDVILEKCSIIQ